MTTGLPDEGPRRDDLPRSAVWAILPLLVVLDVAPYFVTFVEGDFGRDLYAALRIAQGRAYPLEGPIISGAAHLGPVWYYLLAIPMTLGGSVAAVVATVAVLAALRFPLAYVLGRGLFDRRTGLAFAILLALPGFGSLASMWIAHPSLAATLTLAVLVALLRAHRKSSTGWLAAAGAAFGLALHAHPTTLPLALPLAWVAATLVRRHGLRGLVGAAAALALACAPFVPLLAGWRAHVDDSLALSARMAHDAAGTGAAAIANVAYRLVWRVPDLAVGTWIASDGRPLVAWRWYAAVLYGAAGLGAVLSLVRGEPRERGAVAAVGFVLVAWFLFVVAVRDNTRFYMLYALLPSLALVVALGLEGLARHVGAVGEIATRSLLAGALAWAIAVPVARVARALDDDVRLPPVLGTNLDLRRPGDESYARLHFLGIWHLDALARRLCVDGVVHVYGDFPQVVDSQFNVPAQLVCGDRSKVVIGGVPGPGEHAFFLVQRDALEPGAAPGRFGGFGFGRVDEVLVAQPSIPLARGEDYPARKECGSAAQHAFEFSTRHGGTLVIANGAALTCPMRIVDLEREGSSVVPGSAGDVSWSRTPDAPTRWKLVVETAAPDAVQVFTIASPRHSPR